MILFFFFNDTATTEIYTLSLHDALPIYGRAPGDHADAGVRGEAARRVGVLIHEGERPRRRRHVRKLPDPEAEQDRKSTRLNSSHANISYAVFCLKKKKNNTKSHYR